jgi:hypothetical protein
MRPPKKGNVGGRTVVGSWSARRPGQAKKCLLGFTGLGLNLANQNWNKMVGRRAAAAAVAAGGGLILRDRQAQGHAGTIIIVILRILHI